MKTTKLSSKGQVVIPEAFRQDLEVGTTFQVTSQGDLIILKKLDGLTDEERKEMQELERIWKDIDEGKGVTLSEEDFLREMRSW